MSKTLTHAPGAPDAERDICGFAAKFYTEEGNRGIWTLPPEARTRSAS